MGKGQSGCLTSTSISEVLGQGHSEEPIPMLAESMKQIDRQEAGQDLATLLGGREKPDDIPRLYMAWLFIRSAREQDWSQRRILQEVNLLLGPEGPRIGARRATRWLSGYYDSPWPEETKGANPRIGDPTRNKTLRGRGGLILAQGEQRRQDTLTRVKERRARQDEKRFRDPRRFRSAQEQLIRQALPLILARLDGRDELLHEEMMARGLSGITSEAEARRVVMGIMIYSGFRTVNFPKPDGVEGNAGWEAIRQIEQSEAFQVARAIKLSEFGAQSPLATPSAEEWEQEIHLPALIDSLGVKLGEDLKLGDGISLRIDEVPKKNDEVDHVITLTGGTGEMETTAMIYLQDKANQRTDQGRESGKRFAACSAAIGDDPAALLDKLNSRVGDHVVVADNHLYTLETVDEKQDQLFDRQGNDLLRVAKQGSGDMWQINANHLHPGLQEGITRMSQDLEERGIAAELFGQQKARGDDYRASVPGREHVTVTRKPDKDTIYLEGYSSSDRVRCATLRCLSGRGAEKYIDAGEKDSEHAIRSFLDITNDMTLSAEEISDKQIDRQERAIVRSAQLLRDLYDPATRSRWVL